jgi:hypothetical protein
MFPALGVGGGFIDDIFAASVPRGGGGGFIDATLAALRLSWWDISIPILVPYGAVDAYFCCQSTVGVVGVEHSFLVVEVEHSFLVGQQSESNIHSNQHYG